MSKFDEKSLIEDYIDKESQKKGWKSVPSDSLERESLEEPLLVGNLIRTLKRLNTNPSFGDEELRQALAELKLGKAEQILHFFRNGIPVKFEKDRIVYNIRLFDYDNIANNEFILSRQVIHQSVNKQIRNDIILYVNGVPLVNIECKNPASLTEDWRKAFTEMMEYERKVPELYKYVQIGVAAEHVVKYFPTTPEQQEEPKYHEWREPNKDPVDSTIQMLTPETLLDIVKNYLFFRIEHGVAAKVITRYMQYRAAERICNRVRDHLTGKEQKDKGLVWHWQGSGKTLTMIFAANKLYHMPLLQNPTIFFIVDRDDLQQQLHQEFTALDITKPETIDSIHALKQLLIHDEGRGKRGIFITLIHKFRPEELQQLQEELDAISQNRETIQTRKNVIAFVDEGHRTQYGTLAAQMRAILKSASFFAFTGTPISKPGHDTYQQFSYPQEEPYLDKYFVTDALTDGFTVKIVYQPRLEKDVHLNKQMLETFLQIELEEIPEEYQQPVEEKTKERLNAIKLFLENPKRISKITQDIARHFKENIDGKFKAMVVAASRIACVRYKRELDKLLPPEYSEIVMTFNQTDPPEIQGYLREAIARFNGKEIEDIRKEIRDKYKEEKELPKILIVTDMLLTGYDAEILQTMYLDKPLKEHRLLQAIARTNRPYKNLKEAGLVLDYVGILQNLAKAFENYSKEDIKDVLVNMNELRQEFTQILEETLSLLQEIPKDQYDRQTMLKAIETITTNEQNTKKFQQNYRKLRSLFELLGVDEIKIQRFSEFKWLTAIYAYYLKVVQPPETPEAKYIQKYYTKTVKFVHKTTELENIQQQLPTIQFDENFLQELDEKAKTKEEKAANIFFTLNRYVLVEREKNPVYETLAEKVEKLLKLWKQRTKNYEQIYAEGSGILQELNQLESRRKQLNFDSLHYSLLLTLEKQFGANLGLTQDVKELAATLKTFMFKDWQTQQTARKNIERETRKYLRKYIKQNQLKLEQLEELYQRIMQNVKAYGQET